MTKLTKKQMLAGIDAKHSLRRRPESHYRAMAARLNSGREAKLIAAGKLPRMTVADLKRMDASQLQHAGYLRPWLNMPKN
jgi:hypothetical protein